MQLTYSDTSKQKYKKNIIRIELWIFSKSYFQNIASKDIFGEMELVHWIPVENDFIAFEILIIYQFY